MLKNMQIVPNIFGGGWTEGDINNMMAVYSFHLTLFHSDDHLRFCMQVDRTHCHQLQAAVWEFLFHRQAAAVMDLYSFVCVAYSISQFCTLFLVVHPPSLQEPTI
jgi:hypothetical protein